VTVGTGATRIRRTLLAQGAAIDLDAVRSAAVGSGVVFDEGTLSSLTGDLVADLSGFGPLEPFMADPQVTDIVVNGAREVWVDRGRGMTTVQVEFADERAVRRMAQRLAASCGRRLDDAAPYVDAPLASGVRLHAVLPPLADRVSVSIRVPRHRRWSLDDLTTSGMVAPGLRQLLLDLVQRRRSFLICGGTGSGKTTLLNSLLGEVGRSERIVVVEDTRELAPGHPHVVSLQTRAPNIEGAGGVSMQTLVRQTLRMRPDRIVVGEVRGPEVVDLLTALNTGHRGGCGTVHANSAADVVPRLEALAALGSVPARALQRLLGAALEAVVHLERADDGTRRVAAVAVVEPAGSAVKVVPAYTVDTRGKVIADEAHGVWRQLMAAP
jgi:pilus assembly protein CpaF